MHKYLTILLLLPLLSSCISAGSKESAQTDSQLEKEISASLSNQNVNRICEDNDGLIWIATFRGLNKYCGNDYTQYFCYDNNEGLWDSQINSVFSDSKGRMWVSTVNGLCIYHDNDRFERIDMTDSNRNISDFLESSNGRIFCHSNSALLSFNEETRSMETVISSEAYPFFATFYAGTDNTLWAVTEYAIIGYDATTMNMLSSYPAPASIRCSTISGSGIIWARTDAGFYTFNTIARRFSEASDFLNKSGRYKMGNVYQIFNIDDRYLLFATSDSNIYLYNIENGRVIHQDDKSFPFSVPHINNIKCIFRDSQHNIWFGMEDKGYYVASRNKSIFSGNNILQESLKGEQVVSLTTSPDGSLIMAATKNGGLVTYSSLDDKITRYDDVNSMMLLCDSEGNVWSANPQQFTVQKFVISGSQLKLAEEMRLGMISTITEADNGDIWFGGIGETVYRYSHESGSVEAVQAYTDNNFTFIPGIQPVTDTTMMISGFYRNPVIINTNTNEPVAGRVSGDDMKLCIKRSVMVPTSTFRDSKGLIWIGTVANGLLCYDPATNKISPIDGAPCLDISAIEEDREGNIWVSTMHGIGCLDHEDGKFVNFYSDDKTSGNQYYDRSSCILPDGTIIFGGTHGISTINTAYSQRGLNLPLVFKDIKVYDRIVRPSEGGVIEMNLSERPDVLLHYDQNSFSITYSLLDYTSTGRSHYHYMLDGYDKEWHDAGDGTEAIYTRVGAGRYTFRVRYEDDSRNILPVEESIRIRVVAAPWASWWAFLLYCMILLGIAGFFYNMRMNIKKGEEEKKRLKDEKEQEKMLNKMHMSFFANVAHEFRTPLTTISGPLALLAEEEDFSKEQKKYLGIMQKSTDKMMSLVDQFLDFSKLEHDTLKLQVSSQNICEDLRKYAEYFEVSAKMKKISITTEGLEDDYVMLYDQDKLYKIVSNLMSNAIKYTEVGGTIKLGFYIAGKDVKVFVADNGIGIEPELREKIFERYYRIPGSSAWGTGIGLNYVRGLVNVHHGSIVCEANEDGKGSVFTFTLPGDPAVYKAEEFAQNLSQSEQFPVDGKIEGAEDSAEAEGVVKTKILAVDDDPDICNYLKILLKGADYHVKTCFDVDSALSAIKEWEPDLVICDVSMPGKDGYELCRTLRDDISLSHLPVILVTAKTAVSDQVKGLDSGADAYITKPFDPKYLFAVIKSQLEKRQKIQKALNESTDAQVIEDEADLSLQEKAFLAQLYQAMEDNISELELDVNYFANCLHISRTKLYYKVKGLTGESPAAFFKNYKLNKAAELICDGKYNLSEISEKTGFASLSHFSTSFKKHFGMTPSEYAKNKK